jgi:hypothetical protein
MERNRRLRARDGLRHPRFWEVIKLSHDSPQIRVVLYKLVVKEKASSESVMIKQ